MKTILELLTFANEHNCKVTISNYHTPKMIKVSIMKNLPNGNILMDQYLILPDAPDIVKQGGFDNIIERFSQNEISFTKLCSPIKQNTNESSSS